MMSGGEEGEGELEGELEGASESSSASSTTGGGGKEESLSILDMQYHLERGKKQKRLEEKLLVKGKSRGRT